MTLINKNKPVCKSIDYSKRDTQRILKDDEKFIVVNLYKDDS